MARSVETIKAEIKTKVRTYPSLDVFKFPEDTPPGSMVGVFNLIIDVVSIAIYTFEVILDQLKSDIQAIADSAPAGNNKWIQARMFEFQYGDVVILVDGVPSYDPVDESARIITQCSVRDIGSGVVAIKVAKGTAAPFQPLTAPEMIALKDYYYGTDTTEGIGFAGVTAQFISLDPDRLYVEANIYYFGQYVSNTVKAAVILAIDGFLASFADEAFGGRMYMIRLTDAIQAVPGVSRVEYVSVKGRAAATPFASASDVPIQGYWDAIAGHLISEDNAGNTLTDSLTMIEEPAA